MTHENEIPQEKNLERWNALAKAHFRQASNDAAAYYHLREFRKGKSSLYPIELSELPDLADKRLLHLQCHFGMDTISLARMGAEVVGVDFSENAIEIARDLATEVGVEAQFVHADVLKLQEIMGEDKESFDFVFTSHGVLCWLSDLRPWGQTISYFLKPGGQFYVLDSHPFSHVFDNELDVMDFKVAIPYFAKGKPIRFEGPGSYNDKDPEHPSVGVGVSYEWFHTVSDIIMALINADLSIDFFHEHPTAVWKAFAYAKENENGAFEIDQDGLNIPLSFSILATKRDS
ncbi:MAG: class I SAM-dependent methyltransferase [Candidatus Kariarchaeaceae archaeon]|jgi:SAM-dependent methyltransferase